MPYWVLSALESVVFISFFVLSVQFFFPRGIKFWQLWKESGKSIHLTNSIALITGAAFFLTADFLMFVRAVLGIS